MVIRFRVLRALLLLGVIGAAEPVDAQLHTESTPLYLESGVAVSYFPTYAYEDSETRKWGVSIRGILTGESGHGLDLAYTYVPQSHTTASSAPRLSVFRMSALGSIRPFGGSSLRLVGSLGGALIRLKPQSVDCGGVPFCNSGAPREGTRQALVGGLGVSLRLLDRLTANLDARAFRLIDGDSWSRRGDPGSITEISFGVRYRIGLRSG